MLDTMIRRLAIVLGMGLAACGGSSGGGGDIDAPLATDGNAGVVCKGADYDTCVDNTQCTSNNCHLFSQDGIQVCTVACTPLNNATCPVDKAGVHGECNMRGICKPTAANDCTR
jgi:hypothetical protein